MPTQTSAAVRSLFAVVEQYPAVRSQENVLDLQNEIERLEGMIADRRELYNDQVYRYNTRIATFPTLLIAPLFGWRARPLFVATPEEAAVPEINRMTVQQGADAPVERQIWLVRHGETEWARPRPAHRTDRHPVDRGGAVPGPRARPSDRRAPVLAGPDQPAVPCGGDRDHRRLPGRRS